MVSGDFDYLVEDEPGPEHVRRLVDGLVAFNDCQAEAENRVPLGVFVRRNDEIVGGVDGYTHWRWLCLDHLWVDDDLRGLGVGSHLMATIEARAQLRGGAVALG